MRPTPRRLILAFISVLTFLCAAAAAAAQGFEGGSASYTPPVPDEPVTVSVGIFIDQITNVDQKSENFGAVATLRLEWHDPALAYDKSPNQISKVMEPAKFVEIAADQNLLVPFFVVQNQQSKRWIHQAIVVIRPDGLVRYFEKSSLTLQAPYFNFLKYPFDTQTFYYEISSVYPSEYVRFVSMEDASGLGELLGEEEWILSDARMLKTQINGISGLQTDQVALQFLGSRHVTYYVIRVFIPMLILITVSWSLFFLDEYRKRIEIAGANLLTFVAFNWAISADLPKLGYLTFLDFILQWMFVVTGGVIVINVLLRKMKATGKEGLAHKLDNYIIKWVYPLGYLAIVAFGVTRYLIEL
ncbi:hypothetical protein ACFORG_02900 [Lutimaribacter marinistellae]|uniref:Neurotransmitter-gated ion-channel ligand-binding domain-containing protein n=1 Tax=Lutimaribacter marinistellae TaxID=1820329 RepID=A0ABV7TAV8_9RHOB